MEANFRTLLAELPGLGEDNKKLNDTFTSLKATMNTSKSVAPVNRLPMDVLSRIFAILVGLDDFYCAHGSYKARSGSKGWNSYAITLFSVNTVWRRVMINTASFWSHIDICLDLGGWDLRYTKYTRMCLERVKNSNTAIHLHILCNIRLDHQLQIPGLSRLPDGLYGRRIPSLNIVTNQPVLVEPILLGWKDSSAAPLTSLKVESHTAHGDLYLITSIHSSTFVPIRLPFAVYNSDLCQLQTLNLRRAYIKWDQAKFSGLTDLEQSNVEPEHCPSI